MSGIVQENSWENSVLERYRYRIHRYKITSYFCCYYRKNIPCSFLLGAVLLTYADIAARMLFNPYETPIGVFTAIIGIPFFISVARKERG